MERTQDSDRFSGSCLCGAVRFRGTGLREVVYCHCSQCRRAHGTAAAYTATPLATFTFVADQALRWFESSPAARRGFCSCCGSTLLWAPSGADYICLAAGAIDEGPAITASRHVFADDRAPYESIGERLPASPGSMYR